MQQEPRPVPRNDLATLPPASRLILIRKILNVVVPNPDHNADQDVRMVEFVDYAQFIEKKAHCRASSKDDYYAILASTIYRMQKGLELRPRGAENDPYSNIPPSHELPYFMGFTQAYLDEYIERRNPDQPSQNDPAQVKDHLTRNIRTHVIDKLVTSLFPPPDPFAKYDGRMEDLYEKVKTLETEAYNAAVSRYDYYEKVTTKVFDLQKEMLRTGEPYVVGGIRVYPPAAIPAVEENPEDVLPDII